MKMPYFTLIILVILGMGNLSIQSQPLAEIRQRFEHPPHANRILKIIHNWPDVSKRQDDLIHQLESQGFGGVVCNVSFERYLQDEGKWKAFERAGERAHANGWSLWLYDESGYPSATAGGQTLKGHPEWEAEGILIADGRFTSGPVRLQVPPGAPVLAVAYRLDEKAAISGEPRDLRANVKADFLQWEAPEGRWYVILATRSRLFEGTHAAMSLAERRPYPNLLLPEPTQRFLELTHAAYDQRLAARLPLWFSATFTDEPSLMSLFLKRMPYRVLPWSSNLEQEFLRRRGYAFRPPMLTALATNIGAGGEKIRSDFWRTVSELVTENYFGQIQTWCRAHGLLSGGHLLAEEGFASLDFHGGELS